MKVSKTLDQSENELDELDSDEIIQRRSGISRGVHDDLDVSLEEDGDSSLDEAEEEVELEAAADSLRWRVR